MRVCPSCNQEIDESQPLHVTPETVVDIFEIWLAQENLARTRLTEKIPIVCFRSGTAPPKEPTTEPEAEQP